MYPDAYEVGDARELWARHGPLLGVTTLTELFERLDLEPGSAIGVVHVENLTELDRAVTLEELRANDVQFARNIVSGRSLDLGEVVTIFELGGLGAPATRLFAAEDREEGW